MCRVGGGIFRCSSQVSQQKERLEARQQKADEQIQEFKKAHKDAFNENGDLTSSDNSVIQQYESLESKKKTLEDALKDKQFEYDATPAGQAELETQIDELVKDGKEIEALELIARKQAGAAFRKKHKQALDEIQEIQKKDGPDAALEDVYRRMKETRQAMDEAMEARSKLLHSDIAKGILSDDEKARLEDAIERDAARKTKNKITRLNRRRNAAGHFLRAAMVISAIHLYVIDAYAQLCSGEQKSYDHYATFLLGISARSLAKKMNRQDAIAVAKGEYQQKIDNLDNIQQQNEQAMVKNSEEGHKQVDDLLKKEKDEKERKFQEWSAKQLDGVYKEFTQNSDEDEKKFILNYINNSTGFNVKPSPRDRPKPVYDFNKVLHTL